MICVAQAASQTASRLLLADDKPAARAGDSKWPQQPKGTLLPLALKRGAA